MNEKKTDVYDEWARDQRESEKQKIVQKANEWLENTKINSADVKPPMVFIISPIHTDFDRTQEAIGMICTNLSGFIQSKNNAYQNAALNGTKYFNKYVTITKIEDLIDNKIQRIVNNQNEPVKNDVVDLIGYLILYCVRREWLDFTDLED